MIERHLHQQLDRIARRLTRQRMLWRLAACWLAGALCAAGVLWVAVHTALLVAPAAAALSIAAGTAALAAVIVVCTRRRRESLSTARAVERTYPELNDRLLAAAEQQADRSTGRLSYLQREVVYDVLEHSRRCDWRSVVPTRRMLAAFAAQCLCLAAFVVAAAVLLKHDAAARTSSPLPHTVQRAMSPLDDYGLAVEPGDVEIERGTNLLVLARFEGRPANRADVVLSEPDESPRRIELARSLDDPLFGGRVSDVQSDLVYLVEYDGQRSPEYRVTVFDYPRLERADLTVTAPSYAGREPVTVADARRVSVLEGSQVTVVCHVNKPLAAAELRGDEDDATALQPVEGGELAWSATLAPSRSTRYRLALADRAGRASKSLAEFIIDVIPNRPSELKLTVPGKDVRVSPLEELSLEATAWDDVGLVRYGLVYSHNGRETTVVLGEGDENAPGAQDASLAHQLALEDLGAEPDELLSYYFFADDHGPDGRVRRTSGDMFFAEVRPFEEIFREGQQPPGGGAPAGGGPQGQKIEQLAELQKQIVSATWTLIRRETSAAVSESFITDVEAIAGSQEAAIEQLGELREKLNDGRSLRFAGDAEGQMREAIKRLNQAATDARADGGDAARRTDSQSVRPSTVDSSMDAVLAPGGRSTTPSYEGGLPQSGRSATPSYGSHAEALSAALSAERAAYQSLLRLRAREHDVVRGQGGGGGGGGGSASEQQLNQLELTSKQNRYQTEQRAGEQPPSAGREQLQVLNRLRELARRQSGVNQQLKELELALQNARTDEEREEIERRLKRLRDEQEQVLRDLDELRDRMDRPENRQQAADTRQQVDQTRQQVREASDALREGQVSRAISSGTRAERELENLREDFRRRTAHQFADAMNDLRDGARELSERQQQLGESLEELDTRSRRSLRDAEERRGISRELAGQKDRLADVLDRMRQVTEQAEHSEPLLSKQLYDTARQARADAPEKGLDAASQLADRGLLSDARSAAEQAQRGIDALRDGVQKAADAVLGNELDALKRARNDVRDLARDLDRELAQAGGEPPGSEAESPRQTADASQAGTQPGGQNGENRSDRRGPRGANPKESPRSPSEDAQSGAGQPGDAATGEQPTAEQDQPPGQDPSAPGEQSSGSSPSSSESPTGTGSQSGSGQGDGSRSEGGQSDGSQSGTGGADDSSPSNGPGRQQRPSLLSSGGQSGGPGEGPGGRAGPLTGDDFQQWSDRMRDVEETVGEPELRSEVSRIRERARSIRADFKRHAQEPNWDLVQAEILAPLLELEGRLAQEIARRESNDALVPIDRDPVPTRFAEAIREYYERLSDGQRR
ncbi:MAG TPA: hypothetical protein VML55_20505 [Planctomycetaceae bacterium]|nr:hypothetical protein [Planctomycetaceae bacterium]